MVVVMVVVVVVVVVVDIAGLDCTQYKSACNNYEVSA